VNNWLRRLALVVVGVLVLVPGASAAIVFQSTFQPNPSATPPEPVDKGCVGNTGYNCIQAPNSFSKDQWVVYVGNVDWVSTLWNPSVAGGSSVDINGTVQGGLVTTMYNLTPGQVYAVTVQFSGNPGDNSLVTGANNKTFVAYVDDTAYTSVWGSQAFSFDAQTNTSLNLLNYTSGTFTFTAAASTGTIILASTTPGEFGPVVGEVTVQDVGGVPEPATCFSLGAGLLALAALRRRP